MEAKISFLRNLGLQPRKKLKSNSKKVCEKTTRFNCNGCEASFQSKIDLKQHLNLIHLKKSRTLKNSNVNADNIILYKRHIVKVKAGKSLKGLSIYFHLQKDERTNCSLTFQLEMSGNFWTLEVARFCFNRWNRIEIPFEI